MRKLIQFLYAFRAGLVFLVLELVAVMLLVRNDSYHSSLYFNSSNRMVGNLYNGKQSFYSYMDLDRVNDSLVMENAKLRAALSVDKELPELDSATREILDPLDTVTQTSRYQFRPAHVINNNVRGSKNYLTLDKGETAGVSKGMGVVSPSGVVGRVLTVSDNYSVVASMLHSRLLVSAKLLPSGIACTVNWDGVSPEFTKVLYVARHYEVKPGDSVVASGFNGLFPEGTPIGVVGEVGRGDDASFHDIKLRLSNDFRRLDYVYVVEDLAKNELDSLMEEFRD
ncbi:hypothetical protein FUAX_20060 [Fulvitalea axinellae]|uniref:Cell shape-determining protein MreC n=1 Tax=Fulvitalea axinellae TaxID=1182444 RepID=A0AAU9D534_9BACT|nr:hypothetical protein FUAX_20060 [Fulvitalea axinellae]